VPLDGVELVVAELWEHAGTDFDVPALQGLASVVARMDTATLVAVDAGPDGAAASDLEASAAASATVLPFERRVS
jgi:hypothetical protein